MDTNPFDMLKQKKKEYLAEVAKIGQETFKTFFADWFAAHPEFVAVRCTQYTPYFNDGAACVFGVDDAYVQLSDDDDFYVHMISKMPMRVVRRCENSPMLFQRLKKLLKRLLVMACR
jgi:hypothetical protein